MRRSFIGHLAGWLLLSGCLGSLDMTAQVRLHPRVGLTTTAYVDERADLGASRHPGQMIGVDLRLYALRFSFAPGLHYHRWTVSHGEAAFGTGRKPHVHFFQIPLVAGFSLLKVPGFKTEILGGPELIVFYDVDDNQAGLSADNTRSMTTALTLGLHGRLGNRLTADIRYRYGLQSTLLNRADARIRGLELSMGVLFGMTP